jgi:hypothetical protein
MRVILAVLLVMSAHAWADDNEPVTTFHKGQFGLSARFGLGVRGIATYDNTVWCGKSDPEAEHGFASVCTGRTPLALDLEPAYGVAQSIELTLELRIGLERDFGATPGTSGPRAFSLAPGARFFFSEAAHSKLFVQPELVFDFAGYKDAAGSNRGNDFGIKGIEGFWLDLHRSYGIYFYVTETAEFARWLSATFEVGVGFQGRYP